MFLSRTVVAGGIRFQTDFMVLTYGVRWGSYGNEQKKYRKIFGLYFPSFAYTLDKVYTIVYTFGEGR
jgi:hypothetical protein